MPFCPSCREEFREGFTTCSDCGAILVAQLPPLEPDPAEGGPDLSWDEVAETAQLYEAELIAMHLRSAGFEAQVVDQTFHQEPLATNRDFTRVRVMVPSGLGDEARQSLASMQPLPEDADPGPPTAEDAEGEARRDEDDEESGK